MIFSLMIATAIVCLTSTGQVLLKLGANSNTRLIFNRFVILGYGCFVAVILLSAILMRSIEFKYFTIIVSLNYMVTVLLAVLILKEKVSARNVAGCALISLGVMVFAL